MRSSDSDLIPRGIVLVVDKSVFPIFPIVSSPVILSVFFCSCQLILKHQGHQFLHKRRESPISSQKSEIPHKRPSHQFASDVGVTILQITDIQMSTVVMNLKASAKLLSIY